MHTSRLPIGQAGVVAHRLEHRVAESCEIPSWSLKSLQQQEDARLAQHSLAHALSDLLYSLGVRQALAPNIMPATDSIKSAGDMTHRIGLGEVDLYRDVGSGVFLKPRQAFVFSAHQYPTVIASGGHHVIAAYGGLDALVDPGAVMGSMLTRRRVSIVDVIVNALVSRNVSIADITMTMLFAPADVVNYPFHDLNNGEYALALDSFISERWPGCTTRDDESLRLNLEHLFLEQALQAGIKRDRMWTQVSVDKYADSESLIIIKRET